MVNLPIEISQKYKKATSNFKLSRYKNNSPLNFQNASDFFTKSANISPVNITL